MRPFRSSAIAQVFDSYPTPIRNRLLQLRELIFETAASTDGVGEIEECLKWGEPAYLTAQSRSGTTIRMDWKQRSPSRYAMYFHCRTSLIDTFRSRFSGILQFEGNRAIIFDVSASVPVAPLRECIALALTYHRRSGTS